MRNPFSLVVSDSVADARGAIRALYALLIGSNIAAWLWALIAFRHYPVLLGTALLAYGLGLRHAIDADHIAAIDNVTRKLMQDGKRPVSAGFFFSLGHSTVVVVASLAIAATAMAMNGRFPGIRSIGGVIGTLVSAGFLFIIAVMNIVILVQVYRTFHRVRSGGSYVEEDLDALLVGGGLVARIFRPIFGIVRKSWHMYPLGFLFGLGFDTASEIALLGISAAGAARGMSMWSILVFPALFTAGMSIVDTTDSVVMTGAYSWAFARPLRKLYYNLTITAASVVAALLVGAIETLGLIQRQYEFHGAMWNAIANLNEHFGLIGYLIIGVFVVSWGVSVIVYRMKDYEAIAVAS